MKKKCVGVLVFIFLSSLSHVAQTETESEKFRVCVVDGRGGFKRASKYCPVLDGADSKVECVVGSDRLDCLRRISKGTVDFSVFSPEDLVTATNSEVEVLLSNEMRFTDDEYEYKVVAVINDESGIKSRHDLKGKHFCHPGFGYETDWTNILANFLEASVIPQSCNPSLTITENRISSSSKFFQSACKAGPWVRDPALDATLKKKYPNLCELCNSPESCHTSDKYWGRRGPLYCLTDGPGDISWARLSDVQIHFGLNASGSSSVPPEGYSFLCPDDTIVPLNSTRSPCVWVVKPWPVIATKRKRAQEVRELLTKINPNNPNSWEIALLSLIETFKQKITPIDPVQPIESYLDNAPGFLSANSFTGCHPPRTIRICTTSNIANAKCGWLREAATVYAVEPDLDCIKADNFTHCMDAIKYGLADIVFVPPDFVNVGIRDYRLKSVLYETVSEKDKYVTVAVVKSDSKLNSLKDLRGTKACFPKYDGVAWNSVAGLLSSKNLLPSCPFSQGISDYFHESCVPGLPKAHPHNLNSLCQDDVFDGEYGVIRCLSEGGGDVGFLSKNSLDNFFNDSKETDEKLRRENFKILCLDDRKPCHLSWAPIGQGMVSTKKSDMWLNETINVFLQLDDLFGKNFKSVTTPFTLLGIFDGRSDVLFHDSTLRLRSVPVVNSNDKMPRQYEDLLYDMADCVTSGSSKLSVTTFMIIILCSMFALLT